MSKRTLILTGYTDKFMSENYPNDKTIQEVFEETLPSKRKYVKKYGYDLLELRNFGTDKDGIYTERDIGFLRAKRTIEMLNFYDVVMWIDADALITNFNYSIDDFCLQENISFYASWDWNGRYTFNTGNFIVQNTKYSDSLWGTLFSTGKHFQHEQMALNAIYSGTELKRTIKCLDHMYLNSIPSREMYGEAWATRAPIFSPWTKESFLLHITGCTNALRLEILNKYFKEFL